MVGPGFCSTPALIRSVWSSPAGSDDSIDEKMWMMMMNGMTIFGRIIRVALVRRTNRRESLFLMSSKIANGNTFRSCFGYQ